MKIHLLREDILGTLAAMANIADRRPVQPILSHVLLECLEGHIQLTATDGEIQLSNHVPARIEQPGHTALPARKLHDICRALPEGSQIQILRDGEKVGVRTGAGRFSLHTLPPEQFPRMQPTATQLEGQGDGQTLRQALSIAGVAMANNDTRYFLNGVSIEIQNQQICLVGTDGHRLARAMAPLAHTEGHEVWKGILPRKAVLEILRLLNDDPLILRLSDNSVTMEQGTQVFSCKLIDGKYPDYQRVIPIGHPGTTLVDKASFKSALQQIDVMSSDKAPSAVLEFTADQITLRSRNEEQEEAEIQIPAAYQGDTVEIAFNPRYLMDSTQIFADDQLRIQVKDKGNSALFTGMESDDPLYIVMPIRL